MAIFNGVEGEWRTLKGKHVFIKSLKDTKKFTSELSEKYKDMLKEPIRTCIKSDYNTFTTSGITDKNSKEIYGAKVRIHGKPRAYLPIIEDNEEALEKTLNRLWKQYKKK